MRDVAGWLELPGLDAERAEALPLNEIGGVAPELASPVVAEPYAAHRRTGAFLVVDAQDGATLAAGMVI